MVVLYNREVVGVGPGLAEAFDQAKAALAQRWGDVELWRECVVVTVPPDVLEVGTAPGEGSGEAPAGRESDS